MGDDGVLNQLKFPKMRTSGIIMRPFPSWITRIFFGYKLILAWTEDIHHSGRIATFIPVPQSTTTESV
jgi:hypothetical protein